MENYSIAYEIQWLLECLGPCIFCEANPNFQMQKYMNIQYFDLHFKCINAVLYWTTSALNYLLYAC